MAAIRMTNYSNAADWYASKLCSAGVKAGSGFVQCEISELTVALHLSLFQVLTEIPSSSGLNGGETLCLDYYYRKHFSMGSRAVC